MSTIGTKTNVNNYTIPQGDSLLHNLAAYHYTPSVAEEVFEIGIYSSVISNVGKQVTITVRDVTSGVDTGLSIYDGVIDGISAISQWTTLTVDPPIQLTATNTYAVSVLCNVGGWSGQIDNTAWDANKTRKLTGQTSVPTDFSATTPEAQSASVFYAETRASTAGAEVTTLHTLYFTDDGAPTGNPVICESTLGFATGVTAYLNRTLGGEETATAIEAIDTAATAMPQFNCTFSKAPVNGVDTISIVYDAAIGDIKSVTGGIALASATFDSTAIMVC